MLYTSPIEINKTTTIRAYASNGSSSSEIIEWTYSIAYTQQEDVTFSVSANIPLSKVDYFLDDVYVGTGTSAPSYDFILRSLKEIKEYKIKAIGYTLDCISDSVSSTMLVTEPPFISFSNLSNGQSIQQTSGAINLTSYALSLGEVSAVSVSSNHGNIGNATKVGNIEWSIPFTPGAFTTYSLSATSIDTLGLSNTKSINVNVLLTPTTSVTISGSSTPVVQPNTNATFVNTSTSNTGGTIISSELYYGDTKIGDYVVSGSNYVIQYPTYTFGEGTKTFTTKTTDSNGAISYKDIVVTVLPFNGTYSKPSIVIKNSVPESKVSTTSITSTIVISDYLNNIIKDSISVQNAIRIGQVVEVIPNKVYEITIQVNKTQNVTINATNYIGQVGTLVVTDYVINCPSCRKLNLTNYLPEYLKHGVDNQLEYFKFVEFFENTLNSIYDDLDSGCNIGVIEKTMRLRNLHDVDSIEMSYLPYLANMLDYDIGLSKEELLEYNASREGYNDNTEEYVNKILRFVVANLPNTYNIKTTRNSIKILLLSFGIIGNVIETYTTDYKDDWIENNYVDGYVDPTIPADYYPTPHISIGIDIKNTPLELLTQPNNSIARMIDAVESIRPTNVVFDSVVGYVKDIKLPDFTTTLKFYSVEEVRIGKENQLPPFKA